MAEPRGDELIQLADIDSGAASKCPSKPGIQIDNLLENVIGANGLWQWSIVMILVFSTPSTSTFPVFANSIPEKRCRMEPEVESVMEEHNLTFHEIGRMIGPWYKTKLNNATEFVGCERYIRNWTRYISHFNESQLNIEDDSVVETEPCPFGYVFQVDGMQYPGSVIAEFNTVCERIWLAPVETSVYMIGMMCGVLVSGWLGDQFGRKPIAIFMTLVEIAAAIGISLSPNYTSYTIFRGFSGLANMGRIAIYNVLVLELTLARYRSYFIAVLSLGHNFLMRALISLVAFYVPNWRWLNIAITAPVLVGVLQLCFLSESPRWLVSRDRLKEAVAVLHYGYKLNCIGKRMSERKSDELTKLDQAIQNWLSHDKPITDESTDSRNKITCLKRTIFSLFQTFSTPRLARVTVLGIVIFISHSMMFYGLLLYANTIRGNVYIVSFANAAMAIPGTGLAMLLYRFIRQRRLPLCIVFFISFVSLLIGGVYTYIVQPFEDIVLTVTANIAMICLVGCVLMLFIYLPELFPSTMRSQGFGIVSGMGQLGSIVCTFINELDNRMRHGLPILVYTGATLLVLVALFALPDTSGENLADLVVEVDPEHAEDAGGLAERT